jgi:GDP-L-fucose synthase
MKKKIFISGSTGMVGKNLIEKLKKKYLIISSDRNRLDLRNYRDTKKFISESKPEIVLHCAGVVGGIKFNSVNNKTSLNDNIEIGKNLINACYEKKVYKLINFSSSCIYPKNINKPLKEKNILSNFLEETNEGYALAKIIALKLCEYINKENKNYKYKTLIPCNLYGQYDKFDSFRSHMIPAAIEKIYLARKLNKKSVEIWGSGKNKREFMHVNDLTDFTEFILRKFSKIPQIINVGTGKDYSINYYYKIISKVIGYKGEFHHNIKKPEGTKRKIVDVSLQKELGWSPILTLEEGIYKTYNYYLSQKIDVK